jgi:enoyl-CoA hydratase
MPYENIKTATQIHVGIITLDRPDALNALSDHLMQELAHALKEFETNDEIGAIIITGSSKAFAAGADIKGMVDRTYMDAYLGEFIGQHWHGVANCRKPIIAAVAGYALGGGCELAMMCDIVIAAETAKFGQPEIKLGIIPGAGGTQRLTRFIGKSKAMEMCLTGRIMNADEAERSGLVSRVVSADSLLDEAIETATIIASLSRPSVLMAKAAVNRAYETTLAEGIKSERALFLSLFATEDKKEGMNAFIEKRNPRWIHK